MKCTSISVLLFVVVLVLWGYGVVAGGVVALSSLFVLWVGVGIYDTVRYNRKVSDRINRVAML